MRWAEFQEFQRARNLMVVEVHLSTSVLRLFHSVLHLPFSSGNFSGQSFMKPSPHPCTLHTEDTLHHPYGVDIKSCSYMRAVLHFLYPGIFSVRSGIGKSFDELGCLAEGTSKQHPVREGVGSRGNFFWRTPASPADALEQILS